MASDDALRQGVRDRIDPWIKKLQCNGDIEKQWYYKRRFIDRLRNSKIAEETDKANEQHYEVPTDFYITILGNYLKYSCCYWPEGTETLDQAEDASLKMICERAQIENGQSIMDLGSGWGSLSVYIAEHFPDCRITTVSNSRTQQVYIKDKAASRGWGQRFECITADANTFTTDKKFDRILSLEMLEHMRNYDQLFAKIASWLNPSGMVFSQILCHREFTYAFDSKDGSDTEWMAKNFFTGGTMPSADLFQYFQKDLCLVDHWRLNGKHYSKTLEAWLVKLDENIDNVKGIFEKTYGADQVRKQVFNWRLFLIFCAEVFGCADGNEWIVAYHLFKKQ